MGSTVCNFIHAAHSAYICDLGISRETFGKYAPHRKKLNSRKKKKPAKVSMYILKTVFPCAHGYKQLCFTKQVWQIYCFNYFIY